MCVCVYCSELIGCQKNAVDACVPDPGDMIGVIYFRIFVIDGKDAAPSLLALSPNRDNIRRKC